MQQNYFKLLGVPVAWDANSKYQICNVYNAGQLTYQYVPQVTYSGNLYYLNGTALNNGTPPSSDPAYVPVGGNAGLVLPNGMIFQGNAQNQPQAVALLTALAPVYTFTAGTGNPQFNFEINFIDLTVEFEIFDSVNFASVPGGTNGPVSFTYNMPTLPNGLVLSNFLSPIPSFQTATAISATSGGGVSNWVNSAINSSPGSIGVTVLNTTATTISDGIMWLRAKAKVTQS